MSENLTAKKALITGLAVIPDADESLNKNKLILLTSNGMITGSYVNPKEMESSDTSDIIFKSMFNGLNEFSTEKNTQNLSHSYIFLKDVSIINGTTTGTFEYLMVFTDQIIGATIGTAN